MTAEVLLLNASYEPLAVVTRRRAVSLLMRGRVEAACEDAMEVRGTHGVLRVPVVIRLRYYANVPQRGATWSRKAVLRRDAFTCAYCGAHVGDERRGRVLVLQDFTLDHILPVSRGGRNSWSNTVCACFECNQRKANRLPHEAGMRLRWEPKMPRTNYLVVAGEIPKAWRAYLDVGRPHGSVTSQL